MHRLHSHAPDRQDPLLVSFADDVDEPGIEMDLFQPQATQLGETQPRRVGQFQNRPVAKRFRRLRPDRRQQLFHFSVGQRPGQPFPAARQRKIFRHIHRQQPFVFTKLVEGPQRGDFQIYAFTA